MKKYLSCKYFMVIIVIVGNILCHSCSTDDGHKQVSSKTTNGSQETQLGSDSFLAGTNKDEDGNSENMNPQTLPQVSKTDKAMVRIKRKKENQSEISHQQGSIQKKEEDSPSVSTYKAKSFGSSSGDKEWVTSGKITAILVNIIRTEIHSEDFGWRILQEEDKVYDLLDLFTNLNTVLGSAPMPPGTYTQVRLILGERHLVQLENNGELKDYDLDIPSGEQTGLKLVKEFLVNKGKLLQINVDFDISQVRYIRSKDGYQMKPTVKISSIEEFDGLAEVDASGGSVATLDNSAFLYIPPGAVLEPTLMSIRKLDAEETPPPMHDPRNGRDVLSIGGAYEFISDHSGGFAEPVVLLFHYTQEEKEKMDFQEELSLKSYYFSESESKWVKVFKSDSYPAYNTIVSFVEHFTIININNFPVTRGEMGIINDDNRELVTSTMQDIGGFSQTKHIGHLYRETSVFGVSYAEKHCTGFMISRDLMMTNHHCIHGRWKFCRSGNDDFVRFADILDPSSATNVFSDTPSFVTPFPPPYGGYIPHIIEAMDYRCDHVLEQFSSRELDVAIIRLEPRSYTSGQLHAGDEWGFYRLSEVGPEIGTMLYRAGFSNDKESMEIDRSINCNKAYRDALYIKYASKSSILPSWDFFHECDGTQGASGSPIVLKSDTNEVVAINNYIAADSHITVKQKNDACRAATIATLGIALLFCDWTDDKDIHLPATNFGVPMWRILAISGLKQTIRNNKIFLIGGKVTGMNSNPSDKLIIRLNGVENLEIDANGGYRFESFINFGQEYNLEVIQQPSDQTCLIDNAQGTPGDDNNFIITNKIIRCADNEAFSIALGMGDVRDSYGYYYNVSFGIAEYDQKRS